LTPPTAVPARLEIPPDERQSSETESGPSPHASRSFSIPWLPAGDYRIVLRGPRPPELDVSIGRGPNPVFSLKPAGLSGRMELVPFPMPVSAAGLRISSQGAIAEAPTLRPISVTAPGARPIPATARAGARYGPVSVFAFDDSVYLEGGGLWVRGRVDGRLGLSAAQGIRSAPLIVRNGPLPNTVSLAAGEWTEEFELKGEEIRTVDLPLTPPLTVLHIQTAAGFRPMDVDSKSGDARVLGCWIQFQ
jgi:hypothetical protein